MKSIRLVQAAGNGSALVRVGIGSVAQAAQILRTNVASGSTYLDPDTDPVVLSAGESVWVEASSFPITVTLSGAELTA